MGLRQERSLDRRVVGMAIVGKRSDCLDSSVTEALAPDICVPRRKASQSRVPYTPKPQFHENTLDRAPVHGTEFQWIR